MKIAYFDCASGISGDMTLGALISAGADENALKSELAKLGDLEFKLEIGKVIKSGIEAADVDVLTHEHHHHRRLPDIKKIIEGSTLSETTKKRAIDAFTRLAEAEGAVHGTGPEEVHFHEVGAIDAIVDIVGAMIGIELLGIEKVISSPLPMGRGFVTAAHGLMPLPAPATVKLLEGVSVYDAGVEGETVTPTGAAIIRTLTAEFRGIPAMKIEKSGFGAGKKDFPYPNVLRVIIGTDAASEHKKIKVIETNIDDMNPEFYETVFESLFNAGALDVYLTAVTMKKTRPGTLLTAVCPPEKADEIAGIILSETTSLGVRITEADRRCLEREIITVTTNYGEIKVKIALQSGKRIKAAPEYEDCKAAAKKHKVPVKEVYEQALASSRKE